MQAHTQVVELKEKFQAITKEIEEVHKGQVAQDEPHVSVGGLLEVGQSENKDDFGKEGMHEERDSWKEEHHTCMHRRPNDIKVFVIHCNG